MSPSSRTTDAARRVITRAESLAVPRRLTGNFTDRSPSAEWDPAFDRQLRLRRDRYDIIPWLDRTRPLRSARIVEVGGGGGTSTVALAEQGAAVVSIDVDEEYQRIGRKRCELHGVSADFVLANAAEIASVVEPGTADWVIFWASLEHMTLDERLDTLAGAWAVLPPGGLLTVIETPNRLWWYDAHTSDLPYFHWLPDPLAVRYARFSPRAGLHDFDGDGDIDEKTIVAFDRRGRGVSFHEFEVAVAPCRDLEVAGCLQLEQRKRNPVRHTGWRLSRNGRYETILRRMSPKVPRAFLQPFLYLTIRKPN